MTTRRVFILPVVCALSLPFLAGASADDLRERQTAACTTDAFRLCSDQIPDEGRVKACMISRRDELSDGCRAFLPAATRVRAANAHPLD